jgi:hypothetical protein
MNAVKDRVKGKLSTTFLPGIDPDGSERRTVADQPIVIYRPTTTANKSPVAGGLTFVVTAANIPLSKYNSIITTLTSMGHVVIGFFVNVLSPPRNNHRTKAQLISRIFNDIKEEFNVHQYNIVGHSIGGKIALLVTALFDEQNYICNILALDPVDQTPVEFTNDISAVSSGVGGAANANPRAKLKALIAFHNENNGAGATTPTPTPQDVQDNSKEEGGRRTNLTLASSQANITLTFTDTGYWIDKSHSARAIQKANPNIKLILHRNSFHMVYCDDDGLLSWKSLMGKGTSKDRNMVVREETLTLVKEMAMSSTTSSSGSQQQRGVTTVSGGGKMMSSVVGKAKQAVTSGIADLKGMSDEAQKKGTALAGVAKLSKATMG